MEALKLFLDNFADWDSFVRIWPLLWQGLQLTVLLAVVTLPIAIAVGLAIAVAYSFHHKALNVALLIWIDLFRSFPVLVLLILIFYGLPFLGLTLPSFAACVLALTLNNSGYYGEIFRAGIESVAPGQREAARALGLFGETGSLEAGKWCDLAIWDIERPAELVYRIGFNPLHARVWHGV